MGVLPLFPPLPSWERIEVRVTHATPTHPVEAVREPPAPPLTQTHPVGATGWSPSPSVILTKPLPLYVILRRPRDEESGGAGRSPSYPPTSHPPSFRPHLRHPAPLFVIPAKAGTHGGEAGWGLPPLAPAQAGAHPLFPPLPSWERIEVRALPLPQKNFHPP